MHTVKFRQPLQCSAIEKLLARYLHNSLDVETSGRIEGHVEMCAECALALSREIESLVAGASYDHLETPIALAAASAESPDSIQAGTAIPGMKTFSYRRVTLKLQADLEDERRTLITLEVRREFLEQLEDKKVSLTHHDKSILHEAVIRKGKIRKMVDLDLNRITQHPEIRISQE